MRKGNSPTLFCGDINWCSYYEKQFGGSLEELKLEKLYEPVVPLVGIYLEKNNSKRYIHPNIHGSTIYNSQNMEAS